jgi:carboxyl-terminal processing protease
VQVGYGAVWVSLATTPPRKLVVAYTEPGTPAVAANLGRGAQIVTVDGVDLVNDNTQAGVNTLNAGLSPAASGDTHTFGVVDTPGAAVRTVTLTAAAITSTPVQNVKTLPVGTGLLGYFQFNDHIATAESELIAAFTQLKQAGVADLVIDLRYNGGGYLDIASEVAFMVAGPGRTTGRTFELQVFSDRYTNSTVNPVTLAALTPAPFHSTAVGLSVASGTPLPHLDLARVFVLTGPQTCSASEAIMNSLRGVGVNVIEIGSTTCGKPYGFYPQDNCGTTYFSIQFKGVNDAGFGDYSDGFSPANAVTPVLPVLAQLPGCSVADDFTHQLGDPAEARLAAALGYLVNQQCPLPTGMAPPASPLQVDGAMAKPEWLMNRIMRNAAP